MKIDTNKYLLNVNEKISVKDKVGPDCGYIEIFEHGSKNLLASQNNLITYAGRRWLMHKALNIQDTLVPGVGEIDPLEGYIFYFGLGTGGALPSTPLIPIPPVETDLDLASAIPIDGTVPIEDNEVGTPPNNEFILAGGGYKKKITDVIFSDVNPVVTTDAELAVQLQCVVEDTEAVLPPGGTPVGNNINEAGIFVSKKDDPLSFILFSRITFSTIVKDLTTNKRGFTINWNFLF